MMFKFGKPAAPKEYGTYEYQTATGNVTADALQAQWNAKGDVQGPLKVHLRGRPFLFRVK